MQPGGNNPPAPFEQDAPWSLRIRRGGRVLAFLGLPILLSGLFLLALAGRFLPLELIGSWTREWLMLSGAAFFLLGVLLVFGRQWLTFDLSRGVLIRQSGLLTPMTSRERSLSEFNAVMVSFLRGNSESPDCYPLRLRAIAGKDFTVTKPGSFTESRRQAEYLARSLRLPLVDATTDHETTVAPDHAGDSLGERIGKVPPLPVAAMPPSLRSRVEESAGRLRIEIPARQSPIGLVFVAVFLGVMGSILLPVLRKTVQRDGSVDRWALFLLAALPAVAVILHLIGSRRAKMLITASAQEIEIARRGAAARRVASSEILDVDQGSAGPMQPCVVVKTRGERITFGEALPEAELSYLVDRLRRTLSGG